MLSCDHHDYIEIACMYRYSVRLTLNSGEIIEGKAIDTCRNEHKQECILLDIDGKATKVILDELTRMEALQANPNFEAVSF